MDDTSNHLPNGVSTCGAISLGRRRMESRRLFKVPVSDVVLCCIVYGILQCLRHDAPPCLVEVQYVQFLVTESEGTRLGT